MEENKTVEAPAKFKGIVEEVEKLTILELNNLVKLLETKWGVSAAPTLAVGAPTQPGAGVGEEKATVTVHLKDAGGAKIAVIKVVKEVLGLGLKEAKDLVDAAPKDLKADVKKADAEEMKKKLEAAGAKVDLK